MNQQQEEVFKLDRLQDEIRAAVQSLRITKASLTSMVNERLGILGRAEADVMQYKSQMLSGITSPLDPGVSFHPDVIAVIKRPLKGIA